MSEKTQDIEPEEVGVSDAGFMIQLQDQNSVAKNFDYWVFRIHKGDWYLLSACSSEEAAIRTIKEIKEKEVAVRQPTPEMKFYK